VPPRRPDRLAAALARLLRDHEARRRMADNASQRALRFSWAQVAAETLGAFVDTVAGSPVSFAGQRGMG